MGHTRQLDVFDVRRQNKHEDFLRKIKNKGLLVPLPTRWQKFRNMFKVSRQSLSGERVATSTENSRA